MRSRGAHDGEGSAPWAMVALVALGALATAHALSFETTVDDAFIAFRYAEHLRDGLGLVFNPGERVEGYTDLLWVLLIAAGGWLGVASETTARVLGVASFAALPALLYAMGRLLGMSRAAALGPGVVVAASASLALWSSAGLETALYAALLTSALLLLVRDARRPARRPMWGLVLALATLTRPEGGGVFVVALLWVALVMRRRRLARWGLALFAPVVGGHLLFRWLYYGDLLPNTWYAKAPAGLDSVREGWGYLRGFLLAHGFGWSLPALLGLAAMPEDRDWKLPAGLLAVAIAACGYVVVVGGDFLPSWRFVAPYIPLLALLICLGGHWSAAALRQKLPGPLRARAPIAGVALCCVALAVPGRVLVQERSAEARRGMAIDADMSERMGRWLDGELPPDVLMAGSAMGRIPYITGRRTVDMLGLTDAYVAHQGRTADSGARAHRRLAPGYVIGRRPDVVLIERCERELSGAFDPERDLTTAMLSERATRRWNLWPAIKELLKDERFLRGWAPRYAEVKPRGFCYFMQRDDGLAVLEGEVRDAPGDLPRRETLARAYRRHGLTSLATATLREVIARRPRRVDLRLDLAAWLREGQRPAEALAEAAPLMEDPRAAPRVYWEAGAALLGLGRFAEARGHLQTFVRLAPGHRLAVEARLALEQLRAFQASGHAAVHR